MRFIFVAAISVFLSSCSAWVVEDAKGQEVKVLDKDQVASCTKIGKTVSSVRYYYVVGIERDQKYIQKDLESLAKNQAVEMGANAIVAKDDYKKGTRTFDVYHCK